MTAAAEVLHRGCDIQHRQLVRTPITGAGRPYPRTFFKAP
jgi:hypothetical protein